MSSFEWRQIFRYSPAADRATGEAALLPRTWARANRNWGWKGESGREHVRVLVCHCWTVHLVGHMCEHAALGSTQLREH